MLLSFFVNLFAYSFSNGLLQFFLQISYKIQVFGNTSVSSSLRNQAFLLGEFKLFLYHLE